MGAVPVREAPAAGSARRVRGVPLSPLVSRAALRCGATGGTAGPAGAPPASGRRARFAASRPVLRGALASPARSLRAADASSSPTTCSPRRTWASSGMRAARRDASARIRAIASSSAFVGCSSALTAAGAGSATVRRPAPAAACAALGGLPFARSTPSSSRSPSASRSRITFRGRKCSRCWRSTHRRRSTSWSKNFRYPDGERSGFTRPWLSRNRIFEMVTSGNSSRSSVRTSPMERYVRLLTRCQPPGRRA